MTISLKGAMRRAIAGDKPHIWLNDGKYKKWRVSPMAKPYFKNKALWDAAHKQALLLDKTLAKT